MKQALTALALALLLGLSACSGGKSTAPTAYDPAATSKALLDSGAFAQELEALDADMAAPYLGLSQEPEEAVVYTSLEGGYEELAVLSFAVQVSDTGIGMSEEVQAHVAAQVETETETQYKPEDLPKLQSARTEQAGNTVLLVVAADYDKVQEALDGLN